MSRNSKEIKIEKQLKNITDTLNKKMKIACDSLDNNIYALNELLYSKCSKLMIYMFLVINLCKSLSTPY